MVHTEVILKSYMNVFVTSSGRKHTNNYNKSLRVCIRKCLGRTKRCLETVSISFIVTDVSYIRKIYYFLMWKKWLIIWGSFCLMHIEFFLHYSCYLLHSCLMAHLYSLNPPFSWHIMTVLAAVPHELLVKCHWVLTDL